MLYQLSYARVEPILASLPQIAGRVGGVVGQVQSAFAEFTQIADGPRFENPVFAHSALSAPHLKQRRPCF
jgi:hypothetical protein